MIVREEKPDLGSPKVRSVESVGQAGARRHPRRRHGSGPGLPPPLRLEGPGTGRVLHRRVGKRRALPLLSRGSARLWVLASVPATLVAGVYAVAVRAAVNGKDVRESRLEGVVVASASA